MKRLGLPLLLCSVLLGCAQQPSMAHAHSTKSQQSAIKHKDDYQKVSVEKLPNHGLVCITGRLIKIYDQDEVVLQDDTGKVDIFTNHHDMSPYYYDEVTVKGRIDHSKWKEMIGVRKEIKAAYIIMPNNKVIDIQPQSK